MGKGDKKAPRKATKAGSEKSRGRHGIRLVLGPDDVARLDVPEGCIIQVREVVVWPKGHKGPLKTRE